VCVCVCVCVYILTCKHIIYNYIYISAQVAFAGYAMLYAKKLKNDAASGASALSDAEDFVTARASQGRWRIAWSFFSGSLGAWAVTGPAAYSVHAGDKMCVCGL
jgi:hypothetical protein